MSSINTNLPVTVPSDSGTLTITTSSQRIAARMAEDLLGMARSQDSGSIFSVGLSLDEKIYSKAKPLFEQALANLGDPSSDLKEAMRAVVQMVVDKFGTEAAQNMKPYVVRFISEQQSPVV